MKYRLLLLFVVVIAASAATIDVSSEEFVEFRHGAEFRIEYPYPDLGFLDGLQPSSLYWFITGRLPSLSPSSYEFSARLQSLDAGMSIGLPMVQGTPTTLCLDHLACTITEPGIIFIFQYDDALGLTGLVGPNNVAGQPALWLMVRNEGPSLVLGFPGGTFSGFGLTWGNTEGKGVVVSADQFLLSDVPEPNASILLLSGLLAFSTLASRRANSRS